MDATDLKGLHAAVNTRMRAALDHLIAAHFGWWDVILGAKRPV